jgi:hypothetical protein
VWFRRLTPCTDLLHTPGRRQRRQPAKDVPPDISQQLVTSSVVRYQCWLELTALLTGDLINALHTTGFNSTENIRPLVQAQVCLGQLNGKCCY